MDIDWQKIFVPQLSLLEVFIRGSLIYLSVYFLFRFAKRLGGGVALSNILVVVLIADAVQNGMAGEYKSVTEGVFLGVTIIFWNFVLELVEFHFVPMRKILRSDPLLIVKDGVYQTNNMRKNLVNEEEIMTQVRVEGLTSILAVREAYVEDEGQISIIKKE